MLTTVSTITRSLPDADADTIEMQYLSLLPTTTSKSLSLGISFRTVVHVTFAKFCLLPPGVLRLSPRRPWLCVKNINRFSPIPLKNALFQICWFMTCGVTSRQNFCIPQGERCAGCSPTCDRQIPGFKEEIGHNGSLRERWGYFRSEERKAAPTFGRQKNTRFGRKRAYFLWRKFTLPFLH
jgi:hypothetical protein